MTHWAKTYVQGADVATIKRDGHFFQINSRAIRELVYINAAELPEDEFHYCPGTYLGYDEDGTYVRVLVSD